jgi:hypothetical protein
MINLGFLFEGKSCCCIHHTFLLGFPTGWSFNYTPPTLFWRNQPAIKLFSGAVAGDLRRRSSHINYTLPRQLGTSSVLAA